MKAAQNATVVSRGVQMHHRRRKMRHRNPRGDKNKEVRGGGQSLKLLPPDVIF